MKGLSVFTSTEKNTNVFFAVRKSINGETNYKLTNYVKESLIEVNGLATSAAAAAATTAGPAAAAAAAAATTTAAVATAAATAWVSRSFFPTCVRSDL